MTQKIIDKDHTMKNPFTVWDVFQAHHGRQIDKWEHYFPIYEKHFSKYVGTAVRVLEIGVDHGGSLQMWKRYFGDQSLIIGIDINPLCANYAEPENDIGVYIMDQCDTARLAGLGEFDIIIDDGSHVCAHQSITFRALWPKCKGVYLIEDCHNGYPLLEPNLIVTRYPWVIVAERPHRMIRGTPSRELRPDEEAARKEFGPDQYYGRGFIE